MLYVCLQFTFLTYSVEYMIARAAKIRFNHKKSSLTTRPLAVARNTALAPSIGLGLNARLAL